MRNFLVVWNNSHEVGVPLLDDQHHAITSIVNTLFYFMAQGHGSKVLMPIALTLEHYTRIHLFTEEYLLHRSHYPAVHDHTALHDAYRSQLHKLMIASRLTSDPTILIDFFKDIWSGHFNGQDREYAEHLISYMNINQH